MGSDLVVVGSPCGDDLAGLLQGFKPVLVEAFISERAVEALDVGILSRTTGLDQDVFDAVFLCPRHGGPTSELRSVVGSDRPGVAPKRSGPV